VRRDLVQPDVIEHLVIDARSRKSPNA